MKIKLARTAGFCYGVRRAVNRTFDEAIHTDDLYTLGELIHNPQVLEIIKLRGVKVAKSVDEIPSGATVIVRSHGVSPEIKASLRAKGLKVIDATCPKVARVQQLAENAGRNGRHVIIFGDREHSEVKAIAAYAGKKVDIVGSVEELKAAHERIPKKTCITLLAQTTQNIVLWEQIKTQMCRLRPETDVHETICGATDERQFETRKLAREVDAVVVVGGMGSANTRRLAEVVREEGRQALQVETEADLEPDKLKEFACVGVVAGASTPSWMIQRVLHALERIAEGHRSLVSLIVEFWRFIVRSNLLVAVAAAQLLYAVSRLQAIEPELYYQLIVGAYIFGMHLLNHFTDAFSTQINYPARVGFYARFRRVLLTLGLLGTASSLVVSFLLGPFTFILIFAMSLLGLVYRVELLGTKTFSPRRLMDIPGSKDLFLGLAWTIIIAVLVVPASGSRFTPATGIAALFVFSLAFTRSLVYSIRDVQGDRMVGRETIPVLIGESLTRRLGALVLFVAAAGLVLSYVMGWSSILSLLLIVNLAYAFLTLWLTRGEKVYPDVLFETIVEGNLVLSWVLAYVAHLVGLAS